MGEEEGGYLGCRDGQEEDDPWCRGRGGRGDHGGGGDGDGGGSGEGKGNHPVDDPCQHLRPTGGPNPRGEARPRCPDKGLIRRSRGCERTRPSPRATEGAQRLDGGR